MRQFAFLFILILLTACSRTEFENKSGEISESNTEISELKAQLTSASKSGEITPEMHAQISQKLSDLEEQGQGVAELRNMLSQLKIGGQEIPQQKRDPTILSLHAELTYALNSGGIDPKRHAEITQQISSLEEQGQGVAELRNMLSQLKIGGQESPTNTSQTSEFPSSNNDSLVPTSQATESGIIVWQYRDGKWRPTANPPPCPESLEFQSPVDLKLATSILYPGQIRGNDFKPHGGFRTDKTTKPVQVTSPTEGHVWRAVRFTDEFGIHYMFDIQHPCGIMHRFGHLGAVPEKFDAIFENRPENAYKDSRTFELETPLPVALGEVIATNTQRGSGFDWGVYDLRKENEASQDPEFRAAHADEAEQAYHALCWLNYLPDEQEHIVKGLPAADGKSGKNSEYC